MILCECLQSQKIIYLLFNILILIIAMEKKFYVAPSVEIVEVAVEAGFAASSEGIEDDGWN